MLKDHRHDQQIGQVVHDLVVGDEWRIEAALYPPGTTAAADEAWAEILWRLEAARQDPTLTVLEKLAKALKVPIGRLLK